MRKAGATPAARVPRTLLAAGFVVVLVAMALLFLLPKAYFIPATFVAMASMMAVTFWLTRYRGLFWVSGTAVGVGVVSAVLLYLVFYAGNAGIQSVHPLGISGSSEGSIYSLIAAPGNPLYLQVAVLAFDALGYESFFRGVVQARLEAPLGPGAPVLVALLDAAIHLLTLNPLWVVTTFIADLCWGLTYHFTKNLTANTLSHFLWDVLIFIIAPIR